jgi:hypothetical protein
MTAFADVEAVLSIYFDALYYCDEERLSRAFHPRAIYATADETPLLHRTMDEYFPVVTGRQSPASRNEPRRDFVDAIELAGESTARARVRTTIAGREFVDFLTLVRAEGEWRIMSKIFQIRQRDS